MQLQFTREINRLLFATLIGFAVVALTAVYWSVWGPDSILLREDNPRLVEAEAAIIRGSLYDRNGTLLAESNPTDSGEVQRTYMYRETDGTLGYYSLRYGTAGVETTFDETLRGDDRLQGSGKQFVADLLHQAREGSDLRLTLDLNLQQTVSDLMANHTGAAVVLSVPEGEVLALVSRPTYNPNTLDAEWDQLTSAEGDPFFNRVIQGRYQPGGMLQTPLAAAAIVAGYPFDTPLGDATTPLSMEDVTLNCAARLSQSTRLTLREAYGFACPAPFADLAGELGTAKTRQALVTFGLYEPPTLPGFEAPSPPSPNPLDFRDGELRRAAVGQSRLTISPLGMAQMVAGIVNDGNAPQPFLLAGSRAPGMPAWEPTGEIRPTSPIATTNTARQLQDWMRAAVANGAAQNAGRPNVDIGGHAALAYSGDGTDAWFIGFATIEGRRGVAVAVVLEGTTDLGLAVDIGGATLETARNNLYPPSEN